MMQLIRYLWVPFLLEAPSIQWKLCNYIRKCLMAILKGKEVFLKGLKKSQLWSCTTNWYFKCANCNSKIHTLFFVCVCVWSQRFFSNWVNFVQTNWRKKSHYILSRYCNSKSHELLCSYACSRSHAYSLQTF